jgi:hypothetical protein
MTEFPISTIALVILCYSAGVLIGWFAQSIRKKKAVEEAYRSGEEQARKAHEEEKKLLSEELLDKLESMKNSLVSTYEAYEDALEAVDQRLSPGVKEKLSLSYSGSGEHPTIELKTRNKISLNGKTDSSDSSHRAEEYSSDEQRLQESTKTISLREQLLWESTGKTEALNDSQTFRKDLNSERPYSNEESGTDLFPR